MKAKITAVDGALLVGGKVLQPGDWTEVDVPVSVQAATLAQQDDAARADLNEAIKRHEG